jgi:hypothetical protein
MYRGISDFKKGYQPTTNVVKDEKGDLVTDSQSILVKWRNHFSQLLKVHGISDVRQRETHTAEPLLPEPGVSDFEMATENLKKHRPPGIEQIPTQLIQTGVEKFILRSIILFSLE